MFLTRAMKNDIVLKFNCCIKNEDLCFSFFFLELIEFNKCFGYLLKELFQGNYYSICKIIKYCFNMSRNSSILK